MTFGSIVFAQEAKEANEIAREDRFIAFDNGTVLDIKTGLLWAAKDDGKGMDEQNARAYFENYRGGGYTDWRMPTADELEAIYDQHIQNKQGYHVTKLIDISGEWVWCSEGPESVTTFNFKDGSRPLAFFEGPGSGTWYSTEDSVSTVNRALPVRDAGKRDGIYIAYVTSVVKDTKTGLEWIAGPKRMMTWDEARTWVESLSVEGGDWRMPTRKELKTLYKKGAGEYNITPLLKVSGWWMWSGEKKFAGRAWAVYFVDGTERPHDRSTPYGPRAMAVRSQR
jgi:hypothetical protein